MEGNVLMNDILLEQIVSSLGRLYIKMGHQRGVLVSCSPACGFILCPYFFCNIYNSILRRFFFWTKSVVWWDKAVVTFDWAYVQNMMILTIPPHLYVSRNVFVPKLFSVSTSVFAIVRYAVLLSNPSLAFSV